LENTTNSGVYTFQKKFLVQTQWLISVIPATQEVEIGRISVQGQAGQKVIASPSQPIKLGEMVHASTELHRGFGWPGQK
jgi:hypothetical protein